MDKTLIEEEIAHLRRTCDELSALVKTQGDEIARLQRQVALLLKRAAEQDADAGGGHVFGDGRPPHW